MILRKGIRTVSLIFALSIILKCIDVGKNLIIASKFGVSENADVYSAIIVLPEFILIFLGIDTLRGVINSEYSSWIADNNKEELINSIYGISALLVCLTPFIVSLLILFRSEVIFLILPGFTGEKKLLAESTFVFVVPLVFFRSFISFSQAILNSLRSYYIPLLVNGIVSLTVISIVLLPILNTELILNIAFGNLLGNIVAFGFILLGVVNLIEKNLNSKLSFLAFFNVIRNLKIDTATVKILKSCYSLIYVVIANVLFLGSKNFIGSFFGDGAVSSINYASAIPTVITGLIFGAFFAYMLNKIASLDKDDIRSRKHIYFLVLISILNTVMILACFLFIFANEILEILYLRGNFDEIGITSTYYPFIWEVLSMVSFVSYIVPTAYFIAVKKYSLLNRIGTICFISGIGVCFFLSSLIGYVGISAGMFLTLLIYGIILNIKVNQELRGYGEFRFEIFKIFLVSAIVSMIVFLLKSYLSEFNLYDFVPVNIQILVIFGGVFFVLYFIFGLIFKLKTIFELRGLLR